MGVRCAEGDVLNRMGRIASRLNFCASFGLALAGLALLAVVPLRAETCTTQARMEAPMRTALADAALMLGSAVKADDVAAVKAATIPAYASNFAGIEQAVRSANDFVKGDTLRVTQVYLLDASTRQAGDGSEADFSCPLKDTTAETDFAIPGLPPGVYGFAMVEASGGERLDSSWLLAFLLQQTSGGWKMAGFYPHARTAVSEDGIWYWNAARDRVRAKQPWLAWMYYAEADALLRPANFVASTQLDKLRAEQHAAAPPALSDGISTQTPLVVKTGDGKEFHFTTMTSETAADDKSLHLVLHYNAEDAEAASGVNAESLRNRAAAKAMIQAHPELREGYKAVIVFADTPQQAPSVLSIPMTEIP